MSRVRTALGRTAGAAPPAPPAVHLQPEVTPQFERVENFRNALEALGGKVASAQTPAEARAYVESILQGRRAIASHAPILDACGLSAVPGVTTEFSREACAATDVGITSADYALADSGTLVLLTESLESRTLSLLPPCHVAVILQIQILGGLDELFTRVPLPAGRSSAMILITGPSRTGDIEMRLVRGVHGPGEIHVVIIGDVTLAGQTHQRTYE
ncbi:MAG: lactate utilization protein [Bryobacteraceae bacterium]